MDKKKNKIVKVKTFKIPIEGRDKKGNVVENQLLDLTTMEPVNIYEHEFEGAISIELPSFTKKIAQYNHRQIVMANEDKNLKYYKKQIITI